MTDYVVKASAEAAFNLDEKKLLRVLFDDDEAGVLKIAKRARFEVDIVSSAEETIEKIKIEHHNTIVADYRMLGKESLQFLEELMREGNGIPFIVLTGRGMEDDAGQALNLGVDHYVNEHANPEVMFSELAHDIRKAVEKKRVHLAAWLRQERLGAIFDLSSNAIMTIDLYENVVEAKQIAD